MFKKHGILAVTMFLSLILANGVGAGTELEDIVNNKQTATWAYFTDEKDIAKISSSSRWYISPLVSGVPNINDVFSLGPVINGVGGWWTIGKGIGTIDSAMTQITIAPNLDLDPSDTFFDVGRQIDVTDPRIHDDRKRVQGTTPPSANPIVWYFFLVPNRTWYIVNASRTGPSWDVYRLGWAADGGYGWSRIDISGYSVTHAPDPSGRTLAVTFDRRFLSFPLHDLNYADGAYTKNKMTSVLDHSMKKETSGVYAYGATIDEIDGIVRAFTGEKGVAVPMSPKRLQGCYPKDDGGSFSVMELYTGTTEDNCNPAQGLNYDDHPGYDYVAGFGTPVHAAAGGTVVKMPNVNGGFDRCIPKGIPAGCEAWGWIGIEHAGGYVTQYGHLSKVYDKFLIPGATVVEGEPIGLSGDKGVEGSPHLHFEVLKENILDIRTVKAANDAKAYSFVDPYGWKGTGIDPLETTTGIQNVRLWK
jgi:hypothetical protein